MENDFIKSALIRECNRGTEEWTAAKGYISKSGLTALKVSPDHYKNGEPYVETPDKIFGKMYHCFVLQPELFEKEYFVFDEQNAISAIVTKAHSEGKDIQKPRATKEYKEWYEGQMSAADGKILVEMDDFNRMTAMKDKLMSHHYAKMLLTKGIAEQGLLGELETTAGKIGVKLIPDYRKDIKHIVTELKTTTDASLDGFGREAAKYDYHIQAAFYCDMVELFHNDNRAVKFIFVAQEKKKPFAFNLFECSPQFIAQGRYEYEMLLQLYKYCYDNDKWPGYQCFCPNQYGLLELSIPKYAIKSLDYYTY